MTEATRIERADGLSLLHRRQYVIGPRPVPYRSDWRHIQVKHGVYLSYCAALPAREYTDRSGNSWYLLGVAIDTRAESPGIAASITAAESPDVPDLYTTWAGRWILIGQDRLHLDASGFLPCFFVADNELWLSSSLALLCEVCGRGVGRPAERRLRHGRGLQWYALPRSRFSNVRSLLPTQTISIEAGSVENRESFAIIDSTDKYEAILDRIELSLTTFLEQTAKRYERVWIGRRVAVTAGC